jgi:hypothetical protein
VCPFFDGVGAGIPSKSKKRFRAHFFSEEPDQNVNTVTPLQNLSFHFSAYGGCVLEFSTGILVTRRLEPFPPPRSFLGLALFLFCITLSDKKHTGNIQSRRSGVQGDFQTFGQM